MKGSRSFPDSRRDFSERAKLARCPSCEKKGLGRIEEGQRRPGIGYIRRFRACRYCRDVIEVSPRLIVPEGERDGRAKELAFEMDRLDERMSEARTELSLISGGVG